MPPKKKRGRPRKISQIDLSQLRSAAESGLTEIQIAKALGISKATVTNYKKQYPEFLASLKKGKSVADERVELSLFQRAVGYSHPDVHVSNYQGEVTITPIIKHYPPDPTSAIFWLKNRRPDKWRDIKATEITGKDGQPIQHNLTVKFVDGE